MEDKPLKQELCPLYLEVMPLRVECLPPNLERTPLKPETLLENLERDTKNQETFLENLERETKNLETFHILHINHSTQRGNISTLSMRCFLIFSKRSKTGRYFSFFF
jgi:hypothetical protein